MQKENRRKQTELSLFPSLLLPPQLISLCPNSSSPGCPSTVPSVTPTINSVLFEARVTYVCNTHDLFLSPAVLPSINLRVTLPHALRTFAPGSSRGLVDTLMAGLYGSKLNIFHRLGQADRASESWSQQFSGTPGYRIRNTSVTAESALSLKIYFIWGKADSQASYSNC